MSDIVKIGQLDCTVVCQTQSPQACVILCHGFGAPGTDLVPIAHEMIRSTPDLRDIAFIFPQAPIELDPMFDSRAWWMIDIEKIQSLMMSGDFRELQNSKPDLLETRRDQITSIIEHAKIQYQLPAAKIVVGGFSQGSMVATDVALHYPEQLGGLIVWSGTTLNESEWKVAADKQSPLRVLQSHGRMDPVLPFAGAESLRHLLTQTNHKVQFVPFQGEHTIGTESLVASVKMLAEMVN